MEKTSNLNGFEQYCNHKVKVVFDDKEKIVIKFGKLISVSDGFIFLLSNENEEEAINKNQIVRIEKC